MSYFEDGSGSLSIIIHDSEGQVLMSTSKWISVISNPIKGEALVDIFGLQLSSDVDLSDLDVQFDNLQLSLCFQHQSPPLNTLSLLR